MLEILSFILDVLAILISIYALFKDSSLKGESEKSQINIMKQIVLVQQINPNYDIQSKFNVPENYENTFQVERSNEKNSKWISKRLFQLAILLVFVSLVINAISYFNKLQELQSITDLTSIVYLPLKNTLFQTSVCLVIFSSIIIVRGWDKQQSFVSNLWSMKYYTFKIVFDLLNIISFNFITYSFLEKVNSEPQNMVYSFSIIALAILFVTQISWIQYTIDKLTKRTLPAKNYEDKEKQIFMFLPTYITTLILLALTIRTKFF